MQQKVQFIAALLHEPELIIMDEPFAGLDPINANVLKDVILDLKGQGRTILFRRIEWIRLKSSATRSA